jgi:hypothetical protein
VSAEYSTSVFESAPPQSEKRQPDTKDRLGKRIFDFFSLKEQANKTITILHEKQQQLDNGDPTKTEEKLSLTSLALTLKAFKMEGLTSQITKETFPVLSEDELADAQYLADSAKAGFYRGDAKMATDKDLQKLLNKHADEVTKTRDERMKAFLKGKYGDLEPGIPVDLSKERPSIPQQRPQQESHGTGQYL